MTQKQLEQDTMERMKRYSLIGFGDLLNQEISLRKISFVEIASILNISHYRCVELLDPDTLPTLDEILNFCIIFDKEIGEVINIDYSKLNWSFKDIIKYMKDNDCSYSDFLEREDMSSIK